MNIILFDNTSNSDCIVEQETEFNLGPPPWYKERPDDSGAVLLDDTERFHDTLEVVLNLPPNTETNDSREAMCRYDRNIEDIQVDDCFRLDPVDEEGPENDSGSQVITWTGKRVASVHQIVVYPEPESIAEDHANTLQDSHLYDSVAPNMSASDTRGNLEKAA